MCGTEPKFKSGPVCLTSSPSYGPVGIESLKKKNLNRLLQEIIFSLFIIHRRHRTEHSVVWGICYQQEAVDIIESVAKKFDV